MKMERKLAQVFGLNSPVLLGVFDPDSLLPKTSQVCLHLQGPEQELLLTLPDSGMWDAGSVFALRTSARPTSESEFSSWPTPRSVAVRDTMGDQAEVNEAGRIVRGSGQSFAASLPTYCERLWPTARAEDPESAGNHPGAVDSLTGATRNWPTPQAHDQRGEKTQEQIQAQRDKTGAGVRNLNEEASLWRTPDAPGTGGPRNRQDSRDAGHQITIAEQAELWQTPATDSFRSCGGDRVNEIAERFHPSPPDPQIPAGPESSETTHGSRRLSPVFVEWLLGLPLFYTEIP